MFGKKIPVDSELYGQLKKCAEAAGYSSPEEFAVHVLEKEVDRFREDSSEPADSQAEESHPVESGPGDPVAAESGVDAAGAVVNTVAESATVQSEQGSDVEKSDHL